MLHVYISAIEHCHVQLITYLTLHDLYDSRESHYINYGNEHTMQYQKRENLTLRAAAVTFYFIIWLVLGLTFDL